jgi:hypothetical protein
MSPGNVDRRSPGVKALLRGERIRIRSFGGFLNFVLVLFGLLGAYAVVIFALSFRPSADALAYQDAPPCATTPRTPTRACTVVLPMLITKIDKLSGYKQATRYHVCLESPPLGRLDTFVNAAWFSEYRSVLQPWPGKRRAVWEWKFWFPGEPQSSLRRWQTVRATVWDGKVTELHHEGMTLLTRESPLFPAANDRRNAAAAGALSGWLILGVGVVRVVVAVRNRIDARRHPRRRDPFAPLPLP